MSELTFYEGQNNIKTIWLNDTEFISVKADGQEIKVIMEYGQMAGVPWFGYFENGKLISKWNASLCVGVVFKEVL